jgi:1,2-phenylacetyl-CoA epoxidase PaaB subunit|tara:strand:+ start:237 stop:416 length:180 start_codon:yes stop_codon:yes gene_type:complete
MAKYHVTLKSSLPDGDLYWVSDVTAESEDAAMDAAEDLFTRQMKNATAWSFTEADVERL